MTSFQSSWLDPYLVRLEESNSKLFLDLLKEMVKYPVLHPGIAQHSKSPTAILAQIIEQYESPDLIPPHVLGNPNCPRELIEKTLNNVSASGPHLAMLATNETLTRDDLKKLVERPELAPNLAGRSNLPSDLFVEIWENYLVDLKDAAFNLNIPLVKALACNPMTPLKILRNLSKYESHDHPGLVKSLLMSNPAFPSDTKAQFALLDFKPQKNILDKTDADWYPTNDLFSIQGFSENHLISLINVGHPGAYLRTDVIPSKEWNFEAQSIFDTWLRDHSIYKTLWPELRERNPRGVEFQRWYTRGTGFTFFEVKGLDFEHEERRDDEELNYHAIPESPAWIPYEINYSDALDDFYNTEFYEVANWGILEWVEAWNLSSYDPAYISLVEEDDVAMQFIWNQSIDIWDDGRFMDAVVVDELAKPFSWKTLSGAKKAFLIEFIKSVYLSGEDSYYQYAEHFLICIALNPHTDDELIDKYFVDQLSDSQLIQDALELRGTESNLESEPANVDRSHPILWRVTKEMDEDKQEVYRSHPVNGHTLVDFFTAWPEQIPDDLGVDVADLPKDSYFEDESLFEALERIAWKDQSIEIVLDDQPVNELLAVMEVEEKTIYVWWDEDGERQKYFFDSSKEDLTYALGLPLGREFAGIQILFVKK